MVAPNKKYILSDFQDALISKVLLLVLIFVNLYNVAVRI
jgi:hypothetical protein